MVKHIVCWRLKRDPGGSPLGDASDIKARLEALSGRIPGLLRLEVGIDVSRTPASHDVVLYSEFADRGALDAYQVHPEHVAAATAVGAAMTDRVVVDYEARPSDLRYSSKRS